MSGKAAQEFSLRQAARLVGVSESTLRRMTRQGWVPQHRDQRGRLRYGFAEIARLREVAALGVRERQALRTGQLALSWHTATDPVAGRRVDTTTRWYEAALALELDDREAAMELYRRVLSVCETHARAHVNLGRMLHTEGALEAAVEHYRAAVASEPGLVTAWFNLGVALEDLGQLDEALEVYRLHVLRLEPRDGDAHFNAARLCEQLGDQLGTFRHLRHYRSLSNV